MMRRGRRQAGNYLASVRRREWKQPHLSDEEEGL
jgi:hypothetical protein